MAGLFVFLFATTRKGLPSKPSQTDTRPGMEVSRPNDSGSKKPLFLGVKFPKAKSPGLAENFFQNLGLSLQGTMMMLITVVYAFQPGPVLPGASIAW